ncbi:DUF159-domain-containing protein [Annulohypoxylon bovei var. microspora]|nr:DUF159-domain-containing protein [Annulohypoxylon bovei var. microspora]
MCGRYSMALRPAQVRQLLQDDDMLADEAPDDEGDGAPRQSYNFAPSYHGIVYRANVPDCGAGPRRQHVNVSNEAPTEDYVQGEAGNDISKSHPVSYKLQSMKWGLVPFWTKRNPDYGSMMKTINCRDDSLAQSGGMWSTMKARKRCIVVAQGFYEWLRKDGGREKIPHYVKRKDDKLMCFAGLWDMVQYENDEQKHYTYTIITTDSNNQLKFLHDRMPVILDNGSEDIRTWLDPKRHEWSGQLQALLKPFGGELDAYPVSKDVGKVGNDSPTFIIPIDSKENKSNIANFFAKSATKNSAKKEQPEVEIKKEEGFVTKYSTQPQEENKSAVGVKRGAEDRPADEEPPKKLPTTKPSSALNKPSPSQKGGKQKISATSNGTKSPNKTKQPGMQKITKFFANSS